MTHTFGQDPAVRERLKAEMALVGIERTTVHTDDGLPLAVWRAGQDRDRGHRPTILLLHGATFSSLCTFDLAVPGLPRSSCSALLRFAGAGFSVAAVDLAGYGSSGRRTQPGNIEQDVSDLGAVLETLRSETPGPVAVLGWSWGAQLAALLATRRPIEALVYYASRWRPPSPLPTSRWPQWETWRRPTRLLAQWDFTTPSNFSPTVREAFASRVLEVDKTVPTTALRHLSGTKPAFEPERVSCPVLVVAGADDPSRDDADRRDMLDRLPLPGSRELVIAAADHNAHLDEARSAFYDGVTSFLSAL